MGAVFSCPTRHAPAQKPDAAGTADGAVEDEYWTVVRTFWWDLSPVALANTLEWLEFGVYMAMAPYIQRTFFRGSSVAVFAAFATTFFMRPLGGLIFGYVGDRCGRKPALLASLYGILLATLGQGLAPAIPVVGPAFMLLCRVVQGLACGGEVGSVVVFLHESAPRPVLAHAGSIPLFGALLGTGLATAAGLAMERLLTNDQMLRWGWRLPFLMAAVPGAWALYKVHRVGETEEFQRMSAEAESEQVRLRDYPLQGLLAAASATSCFVVSYLAGGYLHVWLVRYSNFSGPQALLVLLANQLVGSALCWVAGVLGDTYGVAKAGAGLTAGVLVTCVPMYWGLLPFSGSTAAVVAFGVLVPGLQFAASAPAYTAAAELFPAPVRGRAVCLYYNLAGCVGGIAPIVCSVWGTPLAPGYFTALCSLPSLLAFLGAWVLHQQFLQDGKGPQVAHIRDNPY